MEISQKNEIISFLLELPPLEKADLIDKLLSSFSSNNEKEIESLWAEESENRLSNYFQKNIKATPMDLVFNRINIQ